MQVNAIISATSQNNKKINTTISFLRESQKNRAGDLGLALNNLTTNVLQSVKVNEMDVETTPKTEPTLTVDTWSSTTGGYYAQINYNGDGTLYLECTAPAYISKSGNVYRLDVKKESGSFSGTIYATETSNFTAKTVGFSRS